MVVVASTVVASVASILGDGDAGNAGFSGILEAVGVGVVPDEVAERAVWNMPASMGYGLACGEGDGIRLAGGHIWRCCHWRSCVLGLSNIAW